MFLCVYFEQRRQNHTQQGHSSGFTSVSAIRQCHFLTK